MFRTALRGAEMSTGLRRVLKVVGFLVVMYSCVFALVANSRSEQAKEAEYNKLLEEVRVYCNPRKIEFYSLSTEYGSLSSDVTIAEIERTLGKSDRVVKAEQALRDIKKKMAVIRIDVRDFLDSRKDRLTESDYQANLLKE